MNEGTPKVIARGEPDKAAAISILISLQLWDIMPPEERKAFCEAGEVWDTVPGREILRTVETCKELKENA
jgi:TRAP-type C4-dicarboxylate transport system substrate-binding protein